MKVSTPVRTTQTAVLLVCKMFAPITGVEEKLPNPAGAADVSFMGTPAWSNTRQSPTREQPSVLKMSVSARSVASAVSVTSY